jgi:hypothetical protein
MKIFKELKKLGYIHYSATTIEELDDLPLNSAERVSEQALVLRWFREKYGLFTQPNRTIDTSGVWYYFSIATKRTDVCEGSFSYEEAELECLKKLIEIVKQ